MTSFTKTMGWKFSDFEKDVSWDLGCAARLLGQLVEICLWAKPFQLGLRMRGTFVGSGSWDFDSGPGSPAEELTEGDVGTVSIVKIVCLSLLVSKD